MIGALVVAVIVIFAAAPRFGMPMVWLGLLVLPLMGFMAMAVFLARRKKPIR